jgi:general secretion pathway protein D
VTTLERTKVLLWVVVAVLAIAIVWWVGFHSPVSSGSRVEDSIGGVQSRAGDANKPADSNRPGDSNAVKRPGGNAPSDANRPMEPNRGGPPMRGPMGSRGMRGRGMPGPNGVPDSNAPRAPEGKPADPNNVPGGSQLEAVNLKDVEMKNVIDKIAQWTGKNVLPTDEALKQKITIYAPEKLPRKQALALIYSALKLKGFVITEEGNDTISIKPIKEAKIGVVPTVTADEPLAQFENKDQIVRKFFKLTQYPAVQMVDVIKPMVGDYGYVGADESTGQLLVIDTVGNLMSVAKTISELDVPGAGKSVEAFIDVKHGDPAEIVQVIRLLMGDTAAGQKGSATITRPTTTGRPPSQGGSSSGGGPVIIGAGQTPLMVFVHPNRKSIVARGSPADIETVRGWVEKLDREEPVKSEYETVSIRYADVREVAQQLDQTLANMPGGENIRRSIMVRPLQQSRQIMVIGRQDLRDMVKVLIGQIDMPTGTFETRVFPLKYADPDQIKSMVDSLYGENAPNSNSSSAYYYYYAYGPGSRSGGSDTVKVISFPTLKQVTVIASPENMRKIEKQIAEWDTPLNVEEVKPRIIELHNSDPVKMVQVLSKLFTEQQEGFDIYEYIYGVSRQDKTKIIGPLYGQLTFQDVPGTKKIIVIEQLIYDLDRQEMGEIPNVVQLKYADSEDLAERLNAMFNREGANARIRRSVHGLTQYTMEQGSGGQGGQPGGGGGGGGNNPSGGNNPGEYTPPWSGGGGGSYGRSGTSQEEPISNVIGRVRFIPDPRTKSLLVLAPREFQGEIAKTISELDVPGKQVLIKAIIVEVDHSSATSLGFQLAADPTAFGTVGENAMVALGQVATRNNAGATLGGGNIGAVPLTATGTGTISGGTTSVYALIDFLIKKTNAKILNQQTLWTEDNEEALFFKGQVVAFTGGSTLTGTGASQQSVNFQDVGMVVQVRPSITPEKHVDLTIHLQMSQLTPEFVNSQPIRDKLESGTKMIVQDGDTVILGGMLFQTDNRIKRKLPLLGDLPLIGGLFQHNDIALANNELLVFITPFVVDNGSALSDKTKEQIERPKEKLNSVQGQLEIESELLDEDVSKP